MTLSKVLVSIINFHKLRLANYVYINWPKTDDLIDLILYILFTDATIVTLLAVYGKIPSSETPILHYTTLLPFYICLPTIR